MLSQLGSHYAGAAFDWQKNPVALNGNMLASNGHDKKWHCLNKFDKKEHCLNAFDKKWNCLNAFDEKSHCSKRIECLQQINIKSTCATEQKIKVHVLSSVAETVIYFFAYILTQRKACLKIRTLDIYLIYIPIYRCW